MEFRSLSWKAITLIYLVIVNGPSIWLFNFFKGEVVLMCCLRSETWSLTLKCGWFLWCTSSFYLYHFCASLRLDTNYVWIFSNHMVISLDVGFMMLCMFLTSKLGCQPWFAKNKRLLCWWMHRILYMKFAMYKRFDQLWLIVHHKFYFKT
jgi:hypothetical protein